MHPRTRTWHSFGSPIDRAAPRSPGAWRFTGGGLDLARSDDGWTRLRVAIDGVPSDRRSWAIDPAGPARAWSAVATEAPVPEPPVGEPPTEGVRRRSTQLGGVEGAANPSEDSRGRVAESFSGIRLTVPGDGLPALALRLARCRDGIRIDLPLAANAAVYGLGERTGGLDKRGRTWVFWNSDDPLHTPDKDPLYQSIPVAYLTDGEGVTTLFSDTPSIQYFDVGEADPGTMRVEAYDAQVSLYLRRDPTLADAVRAYTALTGRMPLPPQWAIGYQQCRYSYFPASRVLEIAARLRDLAVPCDVVYLDIHYMDGYRVFTWDPERFPDPAAMIASLRERGFHVVTIVDPGVKIDPDYPVYARGAAADRYLRTPTGAPYQGAVWPGPAVFPDFSDAPTREWWAAEHAALLDVGVDGVWNDMNEPADFTGDARFRPDFTPPPDLVARNDGEPARFERVHNVYANGMNRATRLAFGSQRPDERGFVLTRAGYAGVQRDAAVWTGDNHSWWEHVAMMLPMTLNLSLSGVGFCGADAGGFQLNADGELFARWNAAACLMPLFRAHSALDTVDHEPWSFGPDILDAVRAFVELRYRLLPYLGTLFEEASRTGAPIIRPLVYHYPDDPRVANRADSFLLGRDLLVAPVRERGVQERAVYLPAGGWYDLWSGELHRGPTTIVADAPLDRLPLYVRGGAVIPYESVRQSTSEPGDGVLRLLVAPPVESAPGGDARARGGANPRADATPGADAIPGARGALYGDEGEGFGYREGRVWRAGMVVAPVGADAGARGSGLGSVRLETAEGAPGHSRWRTVVAVGVGRGLPEDVGEPVPIGDGVTTLPVARP